MFVGVAEQKWQKWATPVLLTVARKPIQVLLCASHSYQQRILSVLSIRSTLKQWGMITNTDPNSNGDSVKHLLKIN